MMSIRFLILFGILIIVNINVISAEDHIHFNPDIFLRNERLFEKFVDCILDEGPCVGPIAKFKKEMPQLMETQCEQCQEQMKVLGAKVMIHIREHKPEKWQKIQEMYNPDHKHQKKLDELLEAYE